MYFPKCWITFKRVFFLVWACLNILLYEVGIWDWTIVQLNKMAPFRCAQCFAGNLCRSSFSLRFHIRLQTNISITSNWSEWTDFSLMIRESVRSIQVLLWCSDENRIVKCVQQSKIKHVSGSSFNLFCHFCSRFKGNLNSCNRASVMHLYTFLH